MDKKLSVKLFGGFSASYGNEVLAFGKQTNSKFGQLFQILMTRPGQGFSKRDIMECLYGQDEVEDPNASLNNTIFRLRKYLDASILPSGDYLVLLGGVLRFTDAVEVESDVWNFEDLARKFRAETEEQKKAELCEQACELYRGEFLPQLSNEQWVIQKSQYYQKLYCELLRYLLEYLKKKNDYRNIDRLAARAAGIYPFGEWEMWRIDSLIALGSYKEAELVYQGMTDWMQKIGEPPSKKMLAQLREIGGRLRRPDGAREDVRKCLAEEKPGQGAYSCTIPGFADCFRMLKRIRKREDIPFSLMLCTLLDAEGNPTDNKERCEKQEEKLRATFRTHLRAGDVYAKYNVNRYLLLCVGVDSDNAYEIGARIDVDFRKRCGGRGGIRYQLLECD